MSKTIPAACGKNHVLDEANTYIDKTGKWHCRTCARDAQARWHAAKREEALAARAERLANRPRWDPVDLAWVAGLFEGEGTVTIVSGGKYTRSLACVTSTDLDVLEPFFRMWPGTKRSHTPKGNAREAHEWRVQGETLMAFLLDVRPYLRTPRVQAKFDLVLEVQKLRRIGSRDPQYGEIMRGYRDRMRVLNHRGTSPLPSVSASGPSIVPEE